MVAKTPLSLDAVEDALRATGGFESQAAKKLGVTHQAINKRIRNNKRLQVVKKDIEYALLDLAESKVIKAIQDEDRDMIKFYLKCKGKDRGYIEKPQDQSPSRDQESQPVQVIIQVEDGKNSEKS